MRTSLLGLLCLQMLALSSAASAAPLREQAPRDTPAAEPKRSDNPFEFLGELGRVLATTERYYVEPTSRQQLLEGALRGMVGKLDPHSSWLDPKEYRDLLEDTEGKFGGIGVEVDLRGDQVTVLAPIEGGPAERAGIVSGDRIVAVDGQNLEMIGLEKLVNRLRGEPGTKVTLLVVPAPPATAGKDSKSVERKLKTVTLTREIIQVSSVSKKLMAERVMYVRVKQFQERCHLEFIRALVALQQELAGKRARGVLLDLRSNPGGLVDEAVEIADEFLEGGTVLTMRARGRITDDVQATPGGALIGIPTVILMNEWSASAAELLAGALQDHGAAKVVGTESFGKGSVQTIVDLPGGGALKLTTARYYTPKGHSVQGEGIHPNRLVVLTPTDKSAEAPAVVRERDLPGALPDDGTPRPPAAVPSTEVAGQPGEYVVPRDPPADPRQGTDGVLQVAFEELLTMARDR